MTKVTKQAVCAVVAFAAVQVALVFYSTSHPSVNSLITASCVLSIVLYPAIGRYHERKMRTSGARSSEATRNSN